MGLFANAYNLARKHNCYERRCPLIGNRLATDGHHYCRRHHRRHDAQ